MDDRECASITVTVAEIARQVVAEHEPAQLPLLEAVELRPARRGGARTGGWTGGSVGVGVDPAVLSEVIYPVLTGAIAQVAGTAALSRWRLWRRKRSAAALAPTTSVAISTAQLAQIRAECVRNARALGVPPAKAAMLADAVLGVLSRRLSETVPDAEHET